MMGLMAAQVLDEGGQGGSSGVEHAVAVQGAEEPVQTGENLHDLRPPSPIARTLPVSVRSAFRVDCCWLFTEVFCAGWLELHSLCHARLHSGARPVPLAAHAAHQPHADLTRHRFR